MPPPKKRLLSTQPVKKEATSLPFKLSKLLPPPSSLEINVVDLNCAVCDATADGQHFGAEACRACAAFFRRTIARRLKYVCRFDDDCEISKACRSLCRSCRLAKCYRVGMNDRAVRSQYTTTIVRPPARKTDPCTSLSLDNLHQPNTSSNSTHYLPSSTLLQSTSQQALLVSPNPIYQTSDLVSTPQIGQNTPNKWSFLDCSLPENTSTANFVFGRKASPINQLEEQNLVVVVEDSHKSELSCSSEAEQIKSDVSPNKKYLQDIVEINAQDYFVDIKSLPPSHPILAKMLIGFECLQRRRDISFSRARECNGYTTRIFIEQQVFDVHQYYKNVRMEIEWVAEMLSTFDGYSSLSNSDKVTLFKHYWIHFIVLERSFDSFRVIGPSFSDMRLVFANGDIVDVLNCNYDIKNVSDKDTEEIKVISQPWFKRCAKEQLLPIKKLQPTEVEMIFALGLMLWKLPTEVLAELSEEAASTAEKMANLLYGEMAAYYASQLTPPEGQIKRISELVHLIGNTEQIVLHRKEDIIMSRTFKTFKVDVYLEDIFETVSC